MAARPAEAEEVGQRRSATTLQATVAELLLVRQIAAPAREGSADRRASTRPVTVSEGRAASRDPHGYTTGRDVTVSSL